MAQEMTVIGNDRVLALEPASSPAVTPRNAPYNIEAEQALLGAILLNNEALNHIGDQLAPEHFYEPVHTRIFAAIRKLNDRGHIANPVTLKHFFDQDPSLGDIGGGQYLARLASAAITIINVSDYSSMIYDLALKRELIKIGEEVVNTAYNQQIEMDASSQIEHAEQKLFNLASVGQGETGFNPLSIGLRAAINRAEFAYKNSGKVIGVSTGLADLDRMLGGMQKSDLLILAGRPSMGKTALATNIAYNASVYFAQQAREAGGETPQSVGFFSLEMSEDQLATRILSAAAHINTSKILKGDLHDGEFAQLATQLAQLSELPIFIDETPARSITALRNRARRLKRTNNLGMLVIDYLQLLRSASPQAQANRVQEISEITQGLKAIAKELQIPVMALSQLSRAVEQRDDKHPQLSDLRESGSIEQDADVVMFVYREEYYLARSEPSSDSDKYQKWQESLNNAYGKAEVIIAKQRNGPIGTVKLQFQSDLTKFSNLAHNDHMPERH